MMSSTSVDLCIGPIWTGTVDVSPAVLIIEDVVTLIGSWASGRFIPSTTIPAPRDPRSMSFYSPDTADGSVSMNGPPSNSQYGFVPKSSSIRLAMATFHHQTPRISACCPCCSAGCADLSMSLMAERYCW